MRYLLTCIYLGLAVKLSAQNFQQPIDTSPNSYEVLTGLRSTYIHRGIELSDVTFETQFNGLFAYDESRDLEYSAWYAGETNSGEFEEIGISLNYLEQVGRWGYFVGAQLRLIDNHPFVESGVELDVGVIYDINRDHNLGAKVSYDTGADGWYGALEYKGFKDVNAKSYFAWEAGVSFAFDLNETVSLSPFVGVSFLSDESDQVFGGLSFEVSF